MAGVARAGTPPVRDWVPWALPFLWLPLWLWGWPRPHVDDLFFTGTAVELVRDGRLANPWIGPWMASFGTDLYLVHPPFFPYILGGWIRIFGVSTAAFTAFHCVVQAAAISVLYVGLRRGGVSRGGACAGGAALFILLAGCGMRPDALALLLVLVSQFMIARAGAARWAAGSFIGASAVLVQSFVVTLVIPLHLLHGIRLLRRREAAGAELLAFTALGVAAATALFAAALPASFAEFFRVYLMHARLATPSFYHGPIIFWRALTFGWEVPRLGPTWLIIAVAAWSVARRDSPAQALRLWWAAFAASLLLGVSLYATYEVGYADYLGLALAAATWGCLPGARQRRLGIAAVLLGFLSQNAVVLLNQLNRREMPDAAAIRAAVATHPRSRLLVDNIAGRFVYDFRLPPGAVDWMSRQPIASGYASLLAHKPADEIWIASEWKLERYLSDSGIHAKRMRLGGITFNAIDREPYRLVVIP